MPSDDVYSIAAAQGQVWAGMSGAVAKFASNATWVAVTPPGLATRVTCISIVKGGVWLGTFGNGLLRLREGVWESYTTDNGLPDNRVTDLTSDEDHLYAATSGGGSRTSLDSATPSFENIGAADVPEKTTSAVAVLEDMVWFGTNANGILGFDRASLSFKKQVTIGDGLSDSRVLSLAADDQFLWVGTGAGGLCRYSPQDGTVVTYNKSTGLADNLVGSVVTNSRIWAGSWTAGVTAIGRRGGIGVYREAEGLASNEVRDMALDGAYLWFATAEGVSRFKGEIVETKGGGVPLLYVVIVVVVVVAIASPLVMRMRKPKEGATPGAATRKRPYEICGGKPAQELCPFCKYNMIRAGKHHCSKYKVPIPFED